MTQRRIIPICLFLLGLLIGSLRLAGPASDLYPVEGDSAKYHAIGQGFKALYAHPAHYAGLWITRGARHEDLQRIGFDSWVLQHAPAYTALLGLFYILPGDDVAAGRFLTLLLFALGAALLFALAREIFGVPAGLVGAILFLLWPAHWLHGTAILTEIPMATAGLAAAYAFVRTAGAQRRSRWFLGGAMIGLLVLTKTPLRFLALPWIVLEALIERSGPRGVRLRRAGWRLAGWGATQIVWLVFLWGFHLSPNPLKGQGDDWLWVYRGNYLPDRGWETVGIGDAATPELYEGARRAGAYPQREQKGAMYREAFLATLRGDPGGMLALMIAKAGIYWRFPATKTFVRAGPIEMPPPIRLQPALAIAALAGLALCLGKGGGRAWLPAAVPIFLTFLFATTHLVSRYNIPALPFGMLYGAGAAQGALRLTRQLLHRLRAGRQGPAWAIRPADRPLWIARALLVLLPIGVIAAGTVANDADPDARRITLRRPGDGVRLALLLPGGIAGKDFASAEIVADMLPSVRGEMTLSIRLSGTEVARIDGRPRSGRESFLLDQRIHEEGDRYARILRSVERHLDGFVRKRRGCSSVGLDYYRQWHRFPVSPEIAFATPEPVLEIVVLESRGGSMDIYLDRDAPASGSPDRVIMMPAFLDNAYELSSYRFDALASDRQLADARLIRPASILSSRRKAERMEGAGGARPLRGEPRIRLRAKLPGGLGLVSTGGGGVEPAYVTDPGRALRMLSPREIRSLQADRDRYISGYVTF
ncbi:MAG: glycosyltransferase family 39 protein [Candidatus Eisenbacteria bacterium]|nr:glycosyltransferase family 39 protein [Candidatus Eisenbacteria bacterium]